MAEVAYSCMSSARTTEHCIDRKLLRASDLSALPLRKQIKLDGNGSTSFLYKRTPTVNDTSFGLRRQHGLEVTAGSERQHETASKQRSTVCRQIDKEEADRTELEVVGSSVAQF
ncbi:hypothetical protein KIN20_001725 [Parelaphostrongylus tenuis]|uniref:Uncharacterized protein n=1 Tax=Parelaphostrongylus tenuis TaxID=148309 RepID=A0AAD5MD06_PARTN|nr:hypothetical protein KIN20_001725 [Parelaphostrongylus tenuis]